MFVRLGRLFGGFARDARGVIALKFALAAPAVALLAVGAIDLTNVHAAKTRLQDLADAAALAGAADLGLATDGSNAIARATAFVEAGVTQMTDGTTVTPTITVFDQGGQRAIRVRLDGHRLSFFANMLPPDGWRFHGEATATSVGLVPLCVLVTGATKSKVLHIKDSGRINAPACLVHSNRDMIVEGGSIAAARAQAVTTASGAINPAPGTGAAPVPDPFVGMNLDEKQPCTSTKEVEVTLTGTIRAAPGIHCGGFKMKGDSVLILEPGEHWFLGGHLEVSDDARLTGQDVVLFFDKKSKFDFKGRALVNLDGRKSGDYAGMVMVGTRGNTQDFTISSDRVESLLGVIYVPEARLVVEGKGDVARDSAWTVVVAERLELRGSPSLFMNANYGASDVPVPDGVGPRTGATRLVD